MPSKIVIIGAGFAGVCSALSAKRVVDSKNMENDIEILAIAPEPVLVMRPRLYESKASSMVHPLETVFLEASIRFLPGFVKAIHTKSHTVDVRCIPGGELTINYDRLVRAAGSSIVRPQGVSGLRQHAFDIDSLDSAAKLESHIEGLASRPTSPGRDTVVARVILVGNADDIASSFGDGPRSTIANALNDLRVETKLGSGVKAVDAEGITLTSGEYIRTITAIWTVGVQATPLTQQIPGPKDALSRLFVDRYLRVSSVVDVFATGDAACVLADAWSRIGVQSSREIFTTGQQSNDV
ncbi:hypothetical protein CBS115989_8764 [Aspergillus niger]|nr:hypothetical protein CBS115989_8764 [Aspergillus niger]KAI2843277.1 hypothetical protein CBS11232_8282 [Aspergillus niger]KAI2850088.1 hypothetical protein CBS11350_2001 [Aspergillus niger]KAI2871320.1 hypothetical protein CBS115988_8710 [Aspergillus niger]KAI2913773.1 hypothetical protein CBS147371_6760 [Aspergillus niger]